MAKGFQINKRGVAAMMKEMQQEFDKHPVKVPVTMDPPAVHGSPAHTAVNTGPTYHGPVVQITGDGAQVAIGNNDVSQNNSIVPQTITPGFEPIATAVTEIMKGIADSGLGEADKTDVQKTGTTVLEEVVKSEPDKGVLRHSLITLKGLLAPLAYGAQEGAADAVQESARGWSVAGIKALVTAAALLG